MIQNIPSKMASYRKKTHPEHKYSVTFVSKVGTIIIKREQKLRVEILSQFVIKLIFEKKVQK